MCALHLLEKRKRKMEKNSHVTKIVCEWHVRIEEPTHIVLIHVVPLHQVHLEVVHVQIRGSA